MSDDLEPLTPWEALDMYLGHRGPELAEKSPQNQKYRLDTFVEFCASIDAVEEGPRENVVLPEITKEDQARDVKLSQERAEARLITDEEHGVPAEAGVPPCLLTQIGPIQSELPTPPESVP